MKQKDSIPLYRKFSFTVILFSVICPTAKSQVTYQNLDVNVPCCNHADSIDFGNDGIFDIKIHSKKIQELGINSIEIVSLQNKIEVSEQVVDSGKSFNNFKNSGIIANTVYACIWGNNWIPNESSKYVGFRKINSINDTTFGWIKLRFHGQNSYCNDTLYGETLAYNSKSNSRLFAGQESLNVGIKSNAKPTDIIYPTPNSGNFTVSFGEQNPQGILEIYNRIGQIVYKMNFTTSPLTIETDLTKGIYIVKISSNNKVSAQRIIIDK